MSVTHCRAVGTTNLLEGLFLEQRRRFKIIPNALGEKPVFKLMFAATTAAAERRRSTTITDLKRRPIAPSERSWIRTTRPAQAVLSRSQRTLNLRNYPTNLGLDR
jgi:hypothetical protein